MYSKIFNPSIVKDVNIPDEARFITSISLQKNTYNNIEKIIQKHPLRYNSRGKVVDAAIAYFLNHLDKIDIKQVKSNGQEKE